VHLVLTDSGLGGLAVCAGLERVLRRRATDPRVRLTFVNAWPEEGRGYNDLPDAAARARVFDAALARMDQLSPDAILVACNTLSILYELTEHRRRADASPVHGIIDAGVGLFQRALRANSGASLLLVGTRTTIESHVHRDRLVSEGVVPGRIGEAACHGLATAIENGPASADTEARVVACANAAAAAAPAGAPLCLGLCCTHYALVADRLRDALARASGRAVQVLDPNQALVAEWGARFASAVGSDHSPEIIVEVISKVRLPDDKRAGVAALLEDESPATARALREYRHVPDLFACSP
jgi:glutamate racemase